MFRNVLCTMVALAGLALAGCGEESKPSDGGPPAGEEGEGEEGEGEGSSNEGEGEGALPSGADGESCGDGGRCQDGYECMTCDEANLNDCDGSVCTCPQWFGGVWWAEFEPRAVDYEYDFETVGGSEQQFWMDQEIPITQKGCEILGPSSADQIVILFGHPTTDGRVDPPPTGFYYKNGSPFGEGNHWIVFQGNLSADRQEIVGTCEGEFIDRLTDHQTWFHITCAFTLTWRE